MPSPPDARGAAPLRVAYDVTSALAGRTGIARYVTRLAAELDATEVALARFAVGRSAFAPPPRTRRLRVPARIVDRWWQRVPWPTGELIAGGADLVHATGMVIPPTRRPLVVTVHDLAALTHPGLHSARQIDQATVLLRHLPGAAAVLAVSRTTADALAERGVPDERIVVSPLGRDAIPLCATPGESLKLPERFVLTVGETAPRKGYPVLLEAISRLGPGVTLVMAGPAGTDEPRVQATSAAMAGRVIRLGHVSDGALAALYRRASALCFPSVAEGFGLPVLEAMATGLPVIASDIAATRELAGDAALYLDPADADQWAQAIEAVAADRALRERMAAAGRDRAAQYTWARTAERTLAAYQIARSA